MITVHEPERSTLHDGGATVEVLYAGPDDVRVELVTDPARPTPHVGARLLCAAVAQARARHARLVHTVLDASAPSGAAYLAALRDRLGADVADISMRRAGSSVMVTLDLLPARPRRPLTVTGTAPGRVPAARTAPVGRQQARPVTRHTTHRSLGRTP